jgi:hypothetical protein
MWCYMQQQNFRVDAYRQPGSLSSLGSECIMQAHLRPFMHSVPFYQHFPQELIWAWEWAHAHPGLAESIAAAGKMWAEKFIARKALKSVSQSVSHFSNRRQRHGVAGAYCYTKCYWWIQLPPHPPSGRRTLS